MKKLSFFIVALVIVALAVFVAVGLDGNQAGATAAYTTQTGKACGYCHVAPGGGGPLTAEGQAFVANGHVLPTTTTAGGTTTTAGGSTTTTKPPSTTTTAGGPPSTTTDTGVSTTTTAAPTTTTTVPAEEPSFTG